MKEYKPHPRQREILDRAYDLIQSVPYKVSLRWLFYRLIQEGYYKRKEDYKVKWTPTCSIARKRFYKNWHPDILADETRHRIPVVGYHRSIQEAVESLPELVSNCTEISLDHFYKQDSYTEIWFEARAMAGQFEYYTKGIDLLPFGGDPSMPFKWSIAKHLEKCASWYNTPINILYFGDLDQKGEQIPQSALKDIEIWCDHPFTFVRCGLTREQASRYNLPENFEKPGQYQWEALEDDQAEEIIIQALDGYIDTDIIEAVSDEAQKATEVWQRKVRKAIEEIV